MKLNSFFDSHPIFRYEEFAEFIQARGIQKSASCHQQLSYHHKCGRLVHIRKFLYAVKPISILEENHWIDPYLIAAKATENAILAYHCALELHGLAYTTFEELTYLTHKPGQPFIYQGQRFRPITFPKSLLTNNATEWGVELIRRDGILIKITSLERTIVDILDQPNLAGGWEEICRSLDHVLRFNTEKVIEYALLLNNATTIAKIGFFLEQLPVHLSVDANHLEKLLSHLPKQPHYMDRNHRQGGKYYKKWNLIVPLAIVERHWEEPDVIDV